MKNYLIVLFGALLIASCDKVENPYPPVISTELDYSLTPYGDSAGYASTDWPTFTPNTNTLRNALIEDFTGHKCIYCPIAADTAEAIHDDYPSRAYIATIHAGPGQDPPGLGPFQTTDAVFTTDWTCEPGLLIGAHLGDIDNNFTANPRGAVNRMLVSGGNTLSTNDWRTTTDAVLASALKVNIQAATNYYPTQRGLFLHTEVEILDNSIMTDDLHTVVYLIEDSIVGKQKMPNNSTNDSYVHREVMRGCISSTWEGRPIESGTLENGKYYFNYSYELPAQYNPDNMHLLIYVRGGDANEGYSEEIYQVIKQDLQ